MTTLVLGNSYDGIIAKILRREERTFLLGVGLDGRNIAVTVEDTRFGTRFSVEGGVTASFLRGKSRVPYMGRSGSLNEGVSTILEIRNPAHRENLLELSHTPERR